MLKENMQKCKEYVLSFLLAFDILQIDSKFTEFYALGELVNWLIKFHTDISENSIPLQQLGHPIGPCYAGSTRLMVDTEGLLWPCEKVNTNNNELCIGSIETGININKVNDMLNISKDHLECKDCWTFRYCGQCVSAITNMSRAEACNNSRLYFGQNLKHYCSIQNINTQYMKDYEIGENELSSVAILSYLEEQENMDIKDVDYIVNPVDSAYILYKIIIILMFKYRLDIKGNDIVKYSNMKSFLDELIYSKEKSISSKEC